MLALALLVASIGLADSLNPSTIAPALLLATGSRAVRRIAGFTAGVFAVSFAGGLLIVLGPGELLLRVLPHPGHHAKAIAELVGGVLLLALAAALWAARRRVGARLSIAGGRRRGGNARSAFALGAGIMAVELPTALPYFAAIAAIVAARVPLVHRLVLLTVFNVAFISPLLVILAIRLLAGERATRGLERLGEWLRREAASLVAGLLGLLGSLAVVVGLVGLA